MHTDIWRAVPLLSAMEKTGLSFHMNRLQPVEAYGGFFMKKSLILKLLAVVIGVMFASAGAVYAQGAQSDSRGKIQVASGTKTKIKGLVLKREDNSFLLRDMTGAELTVRFDASTKVEEKKSNPFRSPKRHSTSDVMRGLNLEVEGRGDGSGNLVAEKIKFSDDAILVARALDSQVVPVENRLGTAENRLSQAEQNAQRMSGQLEELGQVANLAKGGAKQAQDTADAAVEGVNKTNDRISTLDDYEEKKTAAINFKVGSAVLSPEAKATLDEIATQAKTEKGFVIEVRGFASADGSEDLNRRLSQNRAAAVVQYLGEKHDVPLRRIILPFGYGEMMPVADNSTREGRQQNRRVEVRILASRGLSAPVNVNRSVGTNRK
jgi:OmpA-OmpF porin, OOP family